MSGLNARQLTGYLIAGALAGWIAYAYRDDFSIRERGGWEVENSAPWCAVDQAHKTLACRYFSEKHCEVGAIIDDIRGPVGPLCVPRPK